MKKRMIALLLCVAMALSWLPSAAAAADGSGVTVGTASGYRGSVITLKVNAQKLESLGSLGLDIFYDSEAFTVVSAKKAYLMNDSLFSVNTTESGVITVNAASANGISGSGDLLTIQLQVKANAKLGEYPIVAAVTECYGTNLQPVSLNVTMGSVTVREGEPTTTTFTVNCTADRQTVTTDDVWTLTVNNRWKSFASGVFYVEYDQSLFAVDSVDVEKDLMSGDGAASVNTGIPGAVVISYARSTNISVSNLFTVRFRTIGNTDTQTTVKVAARQMLREDHTAYADGTAEINVTLEAPKPPKPALRLAQIPENLKAGDSFTASLTLDRGSAVAAGDFTLRYDPAMLLCTGVAVSDRVGETGGTLVTSDAFGEGLVRFSYVNEKGWSEEDLELLTLTWTVVGQTAGETSITPGGTGVVDAIYNPVTLEYPVATVTLPENHVHSYEPAFTPPTCTAGGFTTYTCVCGDSYISDFADPLGHSWGQWVQTVKPDAENDGVNTRMCTVCGETETQVVDKNIFSDVKKDRFEEAILWAYYNGITTGTGDGTTFSPENACTRKQIVTFLWRAAGEPEPRSTVNPFKDVKADRFEKAILWAFYEGITAGTGDGSTFSPENTCTRKQIVTFLWRYSGEPAPKSMENKFVDVKNDRFAAAILWAAEQGITTGTGNGTTFSPENPCTRKQIVTFLYRAIVE